MALSTTGKGRGAANKYTSKELAIIANGPQVILMGTVETEEDIMINPPSPTGTVTFETPLPGAASNYVVIITGLSTGASYIATMNESGGNFVGFTVMTESEGTCMYMVTRAGVAAII